MNEDILNPGEKKYYPMLDNYVKLSMTTFGKIKLSIIPEGVSFAVYNYFKNKNQMPSYDDFFESCVHQCATQKIDLKPRFQAFNNLCKKHNIDITTTPTTYIPTVPATDGTDTEESFWNVEKAKISPEGIAAMFAHGYHGNPFRNKMLALSKHEYPELFKLYLTVHEQGDNSVKNFDSHKKYLVELARTFAQ